MSIITVAAKKHTLKGEAFLQECIIARTWSYICGLAVANVLTKMLLHSDLPRFYAALHFLHLFFVITVWL